MILDVILVNRQYPKIVADRSPWTNDSAVNTSLHDRQAIVLQFVHA